MLRVWLATDKRQIRGIQREFYNVRNVLDREIPRAINLVTERTRRYIVKKMAGANPGLTKNDIQPATKTTKARQGNWKGEIKMSGPGVPVSKLDVRLGKKTETTEIASAKQSAWLFYNVFRLKYGTSAVFSTAYRITRKAYRNITYRVSGKTKSLAGTGAFPMRMRLGKKGIFRRLGAIKDKLVEMRGPSLFQILDENTAMMRDITRENTEGFMRELEKISQRHSLHIPRQPINLQELKVPE